MAWDSAFGQFAAAVEQATGYTPVIEVEDGWPEGIGAQLDASGLHLTLTLDATTMVTVLFAGESLTQQQKDDAAAAITNDASTIVAALQEDLVAAVESL